MKRKILSLLLISLCLISQGCVISPNFSQYYRSKAPLLKSPNPVPDLSVTGTAFGAATNSKPDPQAQAFENDLIGKQHFLMLGIYHFEGERGLTGHELTQMTSKKGGDYYIYVTAANGSRTGSRMVMTGMTTPSVISTTSQANATGNYNGTYQNNYGGWGTANANANVYGSGSSQTIVGGTQSYQSQAYTYQAQSLTVIVLASPQQQWKLIRDGVLSAQ
jgi:hypothetical protein